MEAHSYPVVCYSRSALWQIGVPQGKHAFTELLVLLLVLWWVAQGGEVRAQRAGGQLVGDLAGSVSAGRAQVGAHTVVVHDAMFMVHGSCFM